MTNPDNPSIGSVPDGEGNSAKEAADKLTSFQDALKKKEQEFRDEVDYEQAFGDFDEKAFKELYQKIFFPLAGEYGDLGNVYKEENIKMIKKLRDEFFPPKPAAKVEEAFSLEDEFRTKSLVSLLGELQTESISKGDEIRFTLTKVIKEKAENLKDEFVSLDEGEGLARHDSFLKLIESTLALIDFGVLSVASLNSNQLTSKHENLIISLKKDGAMGHNVAFNKNALVNSGHLDRDKYSNDAGLVQRMVFVAYQEMKKKPGSDARNSVFSRNQGFLDNTSKELFKYISGLDEVDYIDENNPEGPYLHKQVNIRTELEKFPEEARETMLLLARLKTARDDLGSKAGLWHLGKNKGALKYSDGEKGRPTGVLSAIYYNVGKNLTREMHAASLAWIDPRGTELASEGRTPVAMGNISVEKQSYKGWNAPEKGKSAAMNREVARMMEEVNSFMVWSNQDWEKVDFKRYKPKHWDEDFPAIDVLTNQLDGAFLADDYDKSKVAVLKIIELANSVFSSLRLSPDVSQMRDKIKVLVKELSSEVAKAFAFIGQYENGNQFKYTHEMIEAACRFYLFGILNAIPGDVTLLGPTIIGPDRSYNQLYNIAVDTIINQLEQNSSLARGYKDALIGFVKNEHIKRSFHPEKRAIYRFNAWRLNNIEELGRLDMISRNREMSQIPACPVNIKEGWKSAYQDPASQKS